MSCSEKHSVKSFEKHFVTRWIGGGRKRRVGGRGVKDGVLTEGAEGDEGERVEEDEEDDHDVDGGSVDQTVGEDEEVEEE